MGSTEITLGSPPLRSIALQTHLGSDIDNQVALHPVPQHTLDKLRRIAEKHPRWIHRKPPCGVYNCFGLVWANRRTAVYDNFDKSVLKVRQDDGYRTINLGTESLAVGDLITYWNATDPYKGCYHVGIVIQLEPRSGSLPEKVMILSKWDDTSGEVIHEPHDHPFQQVRLEYWTDRPMRQTGLVIP